MYVLGEQPTYVDQLIARLQTLPEQFLQGLAATEPVLQLEHIGNLSEQLHGDNLYLIKDGLLHAGIDGRPLFYLQEGDLLGLRQGSDLPHWQYSSDEPLALQPYPRAEVFKHIHADEQRQELFTQYLIGQAALLSDAFARTKLPDIRPNTGFQYYAAGEELIHEGDDAEHVFVIIEGHAEAFVNGMKVGDVHKDEIFGAMAVFTQEKRTATVIASEPCTVMVIPKEQFLGLMNSNPRIAHSLIEGMARRIDLMNKEITALRRQIGES
ncbi:Crp/Fnr family transcriptional regulator [Atopomonas hussainii]|uniref:Crp/Fnr family transcriptional regulator n=1 Tax=Atopomonas hussainii TaxID=1429083 RepID=UPI00090027F4|nr:cyclic nucleotide-binding domain-containing protein [Atopomonas hussainii]